MGDEKRGRRKETAGEEREKKVIMALRKERKHECEKDREERKRNYVSVWTPPSDSSMSLSVSNSILVFQLAAGF